MRKTGEQVLDDVFGKLKNSALAGFVSGELYLRQRPDNSTAEDIVISFKTGTDGDFQQGAITVNIWIPDIDDGNGGLVCDVARARDVEVKANEVLRDFTSGEYLFSLGSMIQTLKEEGIDQHFVYVDLRFKRITI
jgi:hypothetical protein